MPRAPSGLSDASSPGPGPWERLVITGKDCGYLVPADFEAVFMALNWLPPEDLEPLFDTCRSMGIEVLPEDASPN